MYTIKNGDNYRENVKKYYSVQIHERVTERYSDGPDFSVPATLLDRTYEISEYGSIIKIINKAINTNYGPYTIEKKSDNQYKKR